MGRFATIKVTMIENFVSFLSTATAFYDYLCR
jgi:hypothetical protein